jgi:hypothetical protein
LPVGACEIVESAAGEFGRGHLCGVEEMSAVTVGQSSGSAIEPDASGPP